MRIPTAIWLTVLVLSACTTKKESEYAGEKPEPQPVEGSPADVCELTYNRLLALQKGETLFAKSSLLYADYQNLWKTYPDLERLYSDSRSEKFNDAVQCGGRLGYYGQMLLDIHQLEVDGTGNGTLKNAFTENEKRYFDVWKQHTQTEGWVWQDIKYNDCDIDDTQATGAYKFCDEAYKLPPIYSVTLFITLKEQSTPFRFVVIKTDDGLKFLAV